MSVLQVLRATTALRNAYTPALGEPVWDTDLATLWVGDGATLGGIAVDSLSAVGSWSAATTVNTGGAIEDDVNAEDWTGHPNADTTVTTALLLDEGSIIYFGNDTNTSYLWAGPKGVTVGAGGGYTALPGDFIITGQLNFDDVYYSADEAAMLALANVKQGDICKVAAGKVTYKYSGGGSGVLANWEVLGYYSAPTGGGGAVTTAANVAGMVAQVGMVEGDVTVVTAPASTYSHNSGTAGTIADWTLTSTDDFGTLA